MKIIKKKLVKLHAKARKIKQKLLARYGSLKKTAAPYAPLAVSIISATAFYLSLLFFITQGPSIHGDYLISKVGSNVVKLTDPINMGSGATGWAFRSPSGVDYIITNKHVCEMANEAGFLVAHLPNDPYTKGYVKVLKMVPWADLCAMTGVPWLEGLQLAGSAPGVNQEVAVLGHPLLDPLTLSRGRIIGETFVSLIADVGWNNCEGPNREKVNLDGFPVCVVSYQAYLTDVTIFGGNSGSPVVNFWGNIVGVVFASNTRTNKGVFVPYNEVKIFLESLN